MPKRDSWMQEMLAAMPHEEKNAVSIAELARKLALNSGLVSVRVSKVYNQIKLPALKRRKVTGELGKQYYYRYRLEEYNPEIVAPKPDYDQFVADQAEKIAVPSDAELDEKIERLQAKLTETNRNIKSLRCEQLERRLKDAEEQYKRMLQEEQRLRSGVR